MAKPQVRYGWINGICGMLPERSDGVRIRAADRTGTGKSAMNKPSACLAVGYGGYAVVYVVSQNCPESRRKHGWLAGVRAGSPGLVAFGCW